MAQRKAGGEQPGDQEQARTQARARDRLDNTSDSDRNQDAISTIGSQSRQRPTVARAAIVESRYSRIKPSNGVAPISRAADAFALVMTDSVSGPVRDAPSPAVPAALGRSVSRTLAATSSW